MNRGYVLWQGLSQIDNHTPIVCVLTLDSRNHKTGNVVQSWILLQNISPLDGIKRDMDYPICGNCIHRRLRTCYVEVWQAPAQVWAAWKRNKYKDFPTIRKRQAQVLLGRHLRIGSYGDPTAVPLDVWDSVVPYTTGITGFTHLWKDNPAYSKYCMASVDSEKEYQEAKQAGFRTYRVRPSYNNPPQRVLHEEAFCPAAKESGKKLTCMQCGYCNGNHTNNTGGVSVVVHGRKDKEKRFNQISLGF